MSQTDEYLLIQTLAWYIARGYPVTAREPPMRGYKRAPANEARREIGFTIHEMRAFDAIRWELIKRSAGAALARF